MKIGDIVQIIDNGRTYSSYQAWADRHNLVRWGYNGNSPDEWESHLPQYTRLYKVVAIDKHSGTCNSYQHDYILFGIEDLKSRRQYIIGEDGVEFVKSGEAQLELAF